MKRKKLTIFLVAVALMLTIYYIKMPDNTGNTNPVDNEVTSKNKEILETRTAYLETRTNLINELNLKMASKDNTLQDKKQALEKLEAMNIIFNLEMSLENSILSLGYDEAVIKIDNQNGYNVYITVVADNLSVDEFIEVAEIVKSNTASYYKVNVNYVS